MWSGSSDCILDLRQKSGYVKDIKESLPKEEISMYQNAPISERVQRIRAMYRGKKPRIDISRYRLVTE